MAVAHQFVAPQAGNTAYPLGAEFNLLQQCCSLSAGADTITSALACEVDWARILQLAGEHRVLFPLYTALKARADCPASIGSAIASRFAAHERRVLRFSAELAGILQAFEESGIEAVCHKGPVLAWQLYGDPAAREFGDLDFLVTPPDVGRARTALRNLGYSPELTLTQAQENRYLRDGYEHAFGSPEQKHLVELQWRIVPRFYSIDIDLNRLFARSTVLDFEGRSVRILSREDLLLVLCVHAAKHQWNQLGMVRDIAALAGLTLDWECLLEEARRLRIQRIVLISIILAHDLLQAELPAFARSHPDLDSASRLARVIALGMANSKEVHPESLAYFRLMVHLRESRLDRARMIWRLASRPNVGEWQSVALPEWLSSAYLGVRAARLAKRLARSAIG